MATNEKCRVFFKACCDVILKKKIVFMSLSLLQMRPRSQRFYYPIPC